MGDRHKPQQGDEARLFEQFNDDLMRSVGRSVHTSPEIIEDACSMAWAQFLAHQPDRERHWKGWLFRTAQREAWRLDRQRHEALGMTTGAERSERGVTREPADPNDHHAERLDFDMAVDVLEQLPPRLRRIAFLRAAGMQYREIGAITGDSERRVNQLVASAHTRSLSSLRAQTTNAAKPLAPTWTVCSPTTSPVAAETAATVCERLWVSAPSTIIDLVHLHLD